MIYLAIVGTSHLSEGEEIDARKRIVYEIRRWQDKVECMTQKEYLKFINYGSDYHDYFQVPKKITIITGDAKGIDSLVRQMGSEQNITVRSYESEIKNWEGYRKRNIQIATAAHYVISITTHTKYTICYHCQSNHERTGGCWTRKYAFDKFGTPGETIVI